MFLRRRLGAGEICRLGALFDFDHSPCSGILNEAPRHPHGIRIAFNDVARGFGIDRRKRGNGRASLTELLRHAAFRGRVKNQKNAARPFECRGLSTPLSADVRSDPATLTTQIPALFASFASDTGTPAPSAFTARLEAWKELDFTQFRCLRRLGNRVTADRLTGPEHRSATDRSLLMDDSRLDRF